MTTESSNSPAGSRFIVDIRVFILSMTIAMCASFFAGVTMGPDAPLIAGLGMTNALFDAVTTTTSGTTASSASTKTKNEPPAPLDLSNDVIAQSLQNSPSGQHLLVDIANVDADFLDSEERLSDAMVRTVQGSGLTMLSYHCHKLEPAGISSVGVLLEGSHISFHTWPAEGVITLDLFTVSGPSPLFPAAVETMERLFGIPRRQRSSSSSSSSGATTTTTTDENGGNETVRVKWSHELRGFRSRQIHTNSNNNHSNNYASIDGYSDLSYMVLSPLDVYSKTQVFSNLTKFHRVDIWDIVELDDSPSHEDGLKHGLKEGDPRWNTPELSTPDRVLFLNGYLVRCSDKDKETHEALTHPAMFAHPNPQRIAIIGGREGGVLREVLKHTTVKSVLLVEPDDELVRVARRYFPAMSNCSDLIGRAQDCFEDDLVTVLHDDTKEYFKKHHGTTAADSASLFDVILVDENDPRHAPEFYTDQEFISSLVKALSPDGVMMINVGVAPDIGDPRADKGVYFVREQLMNQLEESSSHTDYPDDDDGDVRAMLVYEEPRTGFNDPTAVLMVCKDVGCRSRWYARSDQVDFAIYERIARTHSGDRALSYYDGMTQFSYSITPKAWETVYCRREPTPFECAYRHLDATKELHDLYLDDPSKSSFRVESKTKMVPTTEDGEKGEEEVSETFVFATVDIPLGSYIMPKHLARSLVVTKRNLEGLNDSIDFGGDRASVLEDLLQFIQEHGHEESHAEGTGVHFVEIGGSALIRAVDNEEDANIERWVPPHPSGRTPVYSPVYERHRMSFDVFLVAKRRIPAGTEVVRYKGLWKKSD